MGQNSLCTPLNYIETEVKLYVPYLEAVQTRLETLGGKLTAPRIYERNVRYDDPDRSLTPPPALPNTCRINQLRGLPVRIRNYPNGLGNW